MKTSLPRARKAERRYQDAYRLRDLCEAIRSGTRPRRADLARKLDVSARTVQRDLHILREDYRAPIACNRERGIHFTDDGWRLPPITMTEAELLGFFAAEQLIARLGGSAEAELARRALRNMAALLPAEVVVDVAELSEAVRFAADPTAEVSPETLGRLARAANQFTTLNVHYNSLHRGMVTIRDVDVLGLVRASGDWYAIVHDHKSGEVRDFLAARFRMIHETDRRFDPPENWDLDTYLRSGFGMFRGGEEVEVVVVFTAAQAPYARERKYHETQRNEELGDGRLRVSFVTTEAALEQVARWVMQYGPDAEAIGPPELRRLVRDRLRLAVEIYGENE